MLLFDKNNYPKFYAFKNDIASIFAISLSRTANDLRLLNIGVYSFLSMLGIWIYLKVI